MSLPQFFVEDLSNRKIVLDEDNSKHIVGVLRKEKGEDILLSDGKGKKAKALIVDDSRKKCIVEISSIETEERKATVAIGISLIKNASRLEWFFEKATEIGVSEIIPLICERTEKEKFRFDRIQQILISAMLQSQQSWLPILHEPTEFSKTMQLNFQKKFIAHCLDEKKQTLSIQNNPVETQLMLIGPEGDFTKQEIELALAHQFIPVSLGNTRLRTETAGVVAATLLKFKMSNPERKM